MNKIVITIMTAVLLLVSSFGYCEVDKDLLEGTINAAKALLYPRDNPEITYDQQNKHVYVKFTTPASYKVNYARLWEPWRENQWVVVKEFKRSDIPIDKITVQTNYWDNSAIVKATTSANNVLKYAKKTDNRLWLRTTKMYQKMQNENKWTKLD